MLTLGSVVIISDLLLVGVVSRWTLSDLSRVHCMWFEGLIMESSGREWERHTDLRQGLKVLLNSQDGLR